MPGLNQYRNNWFAKFRGNNAFEALKKVNRYQFLKEDKALNYLPIVVSGGIGDLILAVPLIENIKRDVGRVRVYCNYPEAYGIFAERGDLASEPFSGYDYWLFISTIPRFMEGRTFGGYRDVEVTRLACKWELKCQEHPEISRYMHYQPYFDHEIAMEAQAAGFVRSTIALEMMGYRPEYKMGWANVPKDPLIDLGEYITVNDGIDSTQSQIHYRSTKSWNLSNLGEAIRDIKSEYPTIKIVQIGGPKSRPISGVDYNFSGKISLWQSMKILRDSKLHVDIEGGLVHAAYATGVRSVVAIGPTPPKFFGYPENINLTAGDCHGCFWIKSDWMDRCPIYQAPKCMDSISWIQIYEAVAEALEDL